LPRVGRQGFHIAALPFGINGVEGERGFAGTGEPCKDDKLVSRQLKVDIA